MTNLDNEIHRIATFLNWQLNYPSVLNLARAGLVYTGSGDEVRCYKCHCVISDWREDDVPLERHRRSSPNCPLVASYSLPTHSLTPRSPITCPSEDFSRRSSPFPHPNLYVSSSRKPGTLITHPSEDFSTPSSPCPRPSLYDSSSRIPGTLITHPSEDFSRPSSPFPHPHLYDSSSRSIASPTAQMPTSGASGLRTDDLQNGAHLKFESQRFRTFDTWSIPHVSRRDLAKAGFFFTGIGDCVKCAFCNNILKQWEQGDSPDDEHRKHFPKCPFVLGLNVGNVPEDRVMRGQPAHVQQPQRHAAAAAAGGRKSYYSSPDVTPYESRNSLNFDMHFADLNQRLHSYENKPLPKGQEKEALAEAGFYYVGPGDSVKCFQCGGVLKKWSAMDEPWIEHARWFPHCIFLLRVKGHKFINDVEQRFNGPGVMETERNSENPSLAEFGNEDTIPKIRMEEAEQEESTSLKQEFLPSTISASSPSVSGASSGATNVQLPTKVTYPPEMPSSSSTVLSSSSSSPPTVPTSSTTSVKPSKADDEEIAVVAQENQRLKDAVLCKICMDETANTVFLPCGHLLCCENCAPAIQDCPVCRGIIKGTLKVYIS